jgi:hypothetical protein
VQLGHRLFLAGLGTLALTLTGAVLLVLDVAVNREFAVAAAVAVGAVLVLLWFVLALWLVRRARAGCEVPVERPGEPGFRGWHKAV